MINDAGNRSETLAVAQQKTAVIVRILNVADAAMYLQLRVQSEHEHPQFAGFNAERELAAGASGIAGLLSTYAAEGTVVLGAFEGDRLVGVVALSRRLSPKYRHKMFLWGLYVQPEHRGDGVADGLMETALAWASFRADVLAIWLQVTLGNFRGRRFYERHGFSVFGTEQRALYAADEYHGVQYMERNLERF